MRYTIITVFAILMFAVSTLYFFMFSRNQERFMQFWGLSWIAYSLSLFSLLLFLITDQSLFLELRKIVDMFNILFLLFGSYSFMHQKTPAYWYRFSLYLLLLAGICIIYHFELLSFYLPISLYQLSITLFICYNVLRRWSIRTGERIIAAVIFFLWGAGKSVFSIAELFAGIPDSFFLIEIAMSNVVNFCILTLYVPYGRPGNVLTNSLYRTVVEHTRGTMFYYRLRPEPAFAYISPSIQELAGYTPNDFYTNPRLLFEMTSQAFSGDIADLFEGKLKRNEYPALELYRKDGETFWCEFEYSFLTDEQGDNAAIVGILRDVTNMKTAEVEQVNETRRRNILLSYISHELRTPITSIAGFLTAMQDGTLDTKEKKQEALDIITAKTLTLKTLIDDLDQLAKFESNQFTFQYEAWSVGDVTETLLNRNVPDVEQKGFRVFVDADLSALSRYWVIIDLERICQVFSNLISNAVKYSAEHRTLHLRFVVDETAENYEVSVRDEGIGIADSQLSHVFDRFYRVGYNSNVDASGRGLGLTLSKEIMEAHHGEIYVDSIYGAGSTFTFTIPLYQEG